MTGYLSDDDPYDDPDADRFLTVDDAASVTGVPRNTIRSWIRRDKLSTYGRDPLGRTLVFVADIRKKKRT